MLLIRKLLHPEVVQSASTIKSGLNILEDTSKEARVQKSFVPIIASSRQTDGIVSLEQISQPFVIAGAQVGELCGLLKVTK